MSQSGSRPTNKTTDPVARVAEENNSASPRKGISAGSADGNDKPNLGPAVVSTDFDEANTASSVATSPLTGRAVRAIQFTPQTPRK